MLYLPTSVRDKWGFSVRKEDPLSWGGSSTGFPCLYVMHPAFACQSGYFLKLSSEPCFVICVLCRTHLYPKNQGFVVFLAREVFQLDNLLRGLVSQMNVGYQQFPVVATGYEELVLWNKLKLIPPKSKGSLRMLAACKVYCISFLLNNGKCKHELLFSVR